jgi:putative peptidoglycan lipid II flippase
MSDADDAVKPARSVALATMASRVLGLVRDKATVYFFSRSSADALYLAWTVPNLFRRLFGEGALSAALVPVLAETEQREGRAGRNRVARSVIWSLIALLAPLTLALLAALLLVPERHFLRFFESDATGHETLRLLRLTLPYLLLICVAGQMQAVANLAGRFFFPALAPALGNLTWIAGALVAGWLAAGSGTGRNEPDTLWVAIGILVGGVVQVLCQWLELLRAGENCLAFAPIRSREVTEVSRRMAPMLFGLAASQINVLVDRFVAEAMVPGDGAVTQLYLGNRLMQLPLGVVGVALGTAVYPALARAAARLEWDELGRALGAALRTATTLCVPAIVGLVALAAPIMGLLFEGGEFSAADAEASGACLAASAPTLLFQTAVLLLARADYAGGNQRRPVVVSAIAVGLNVVLDFALVIPFGAAGVAAATTIATLVNAWLLARGQERGGFALRRELLRPALRVAAAATVMLLVLLAYRFGLERIGPPAWGTLLGMKLPVRHALLVGGGIVMGLATFFVSARQLCPAELDELLRLLRGRGGRRSARMSRP